MMTDIPPPLPTLARYAIMVDVGYIYAAAGELLFSSSSRREYRVDTDKLIQALTRHADTQVRGELLRVYWYDAARDRAHKPWQQEQQSGRRLRDDDKPACKWPLIVSAAGNRGDG